MARKLDIIDTVQGKVHICQLQGTLDGETFAQFETHLTKLISKGTTRFVFDLSTLQFISSAGVGIIVNCLRQVKAKDGNVVLVRPTAIVSEIIEVLGLGNLFTVTANLDAGIASAASF